MAVNMAPGLRAALMDRLAANGVNMLTEVKYEEITDRGLLILHEGQRKTIEADTIVLAAGVRSNNELYKAIEGMVPEVYLAGDCVEPKRILEAIHDGSHIGRII